MVLIRGRLSLREDRPRLMAEDVTPLESALKARVRGIQIRLGQDVERPALEQLKKTLSTSPGPVPVELSFENGGGGGGVRVMVGSTLHVEPSQELLQALIDLVGPDSISIRK